VTAAALNKVEESGVVTGEDEKRETARMVGVAALKIGDMVNHRTKDYIFDYLPPVGTHPRLLLRPEDLPEMRRRITDPKTSGFYTNIVSLAASANESNLPPRTGDNNFNQTRLREIQAKAFMFLMDQTANENRGKEAIRNIKNFINTYEFNPSWNTYLRGIQIGQMMYTAALVYDWCFPLLSPDDQNWFHNAIHKLADVHEFGYNGGVADSESVVNGHSVESMVRDFLSAGIAMADENWKMYYDAGLRFVDRFAPAVNLYTWMGPHHQGVGYGSERIHWKILGDVMFNRMLHPDDRAPSFYDPNFRGIERPPGTSLLHVDSLIEQFY